MPLMGQKNSQTLQHLSGEAFLFCKSPLTSLQEGAILVGSAGEVIAFNNKFMQMWRIPRVFLTSRNMEKIIEHILKQIKEDDRLALKIKTASDLGADYYQLLQAMDGRIIACFSKPQATPKVKTGRLWVFKDLTENTFMEKNPLQLKDLLCTLPMAFMISDWAGRVRYINPAGKFLMEQLGIRRPESFLPPDHSALVKACLKNHQHYCQSIVCAQNHLYSWTYHSLSTYAVAHYATDITALNNANHELACLPKKN